MSARKWHNGPPPHVGWWNASNNKSPDVWRWWDGSRWSLSVVGCFASARRAAAISKSKTTDPRIQWSTYWPENARVPRIKG